MASRIDNTGRRYVIRDEPLGCRAWWIGDDGAAQRGPSGHKPPALRRRLGMEGAVEIVTADAALIATISAVAEGSRL